MAKLIVDFITSLDGYASAEGWPCWWGIQGPEYLAWLDQRPDRGHTLLMGANTYRLMYGFASAPDSNMTDEERASIAELAAAPKVVFSSTLKAPLSWPNTRLIDGDAAAAVAVMKREGANLSTLGSLSLCRSLLTAGLVDRFRVVVFPVITGKDRQRAHLRRLSRRCARYGRLPHLRWAHPAARVRSHGAQRPASCYARLLTSRDGGAAPLRVM
jgi:dihydrofolate reductase